MFREPNVGVDDDAHKTEDLRVLRADNKMRELISKYGHFTLKRRSGFLTLCRSVIAQQISTKAADTIRQKFHQRFGLGPQLIAQATVDDVQQCGLSVTKATCLRDLANRALAGEFEHLDQLSDPQVLDRLTSIKGVGLWTAEMFLIFSLARSDVWPLRDAGLRAAAQQVYGFETIEELESLGSRFVPLRSTAALYLWRSLENTEENR